MLFFYQPHVSDNQLFLDGDEYQHCVKVLRKKVGDEIGILDGKGKNFIVKIKEINRNECVFSIIQENKLSPKAFYNHIAIAPTKSSDRIEWFVEKACELGVDEITFLKTQNAERSKLRTDRLQKKAISALKQSKSGYLTKINELEPIKAVLQQTSPDARKFIATVLPDLPYAAKSIPTNKPIIQLIGPEGDFTQEEVDLATQHGFSPVSLGLSTLRTETAGVVAAHLVNVVNGY